MLNTSSPISPKKRFSWGFLILWLSVIILLASYLVRHFPEVLINQSGHIHVISVGVFFAYLILVFVAQYFRFSETIKYLILWLGIILIILGIYSYQYQLAKVWNTIGKEVFNFKSPEMHAESMKFPSNSKGHYMIEAIVEGVPIKFKLDTGATLVVLTQMDAGRLGLMVNE
ncbi:MAG: RDD family protein, partial [Alphaproteobacteria bacterium]|nr:RDD family protein [Alphaproteobacteria bacterium]